MLRLLPDFHKYTELKYISSVRLLTGTFPSCKDGNCECSVLDGAGFLVMHKYFLSPDIKAKDLEYVKKHDDSCLFGRCINAEPTENAPSHQCQVVSVHAFHNWTFITAEINFQLASKNILK